MSSEEVRAQGLAQACLSSLPGGALAQLIGSPGEADSRLKPERVLTRSGWHRLGGVVDGGYQRVAESIAQWADQESGGEVEELLARHAGAGYFATRLRGQTHYLVFPKGLSAAGFVQLEVEELQEVLDRYLIDPDWLPESLEEFIDPLDYPRVEPEPIGAPRFMISGRLVPFELGEAVAIDLAGEFDYLPSRDHPLLLEWRRQPYAF